MLDIIIKGGYVIDGSGSQRQKADVGIRDDRIVAVGNIDEDAKQTLDATGKIVAPGFIDIHTHYDAQAFWDPTLSPSPFHGVTTIVGGNCGFSIAPLSANPADGEYLKRMLARVEGMPLESLNAGVPWDWTSFGSFLDKLDGTLAINAGFMVGHCAIRRTVMGERAVGNEATPEELAEMEALLRTSIAEGGLGFSSTVSPTHNDLDGHPVPSRAASIEELTALASIVSEYQGTSLEILPGVGAFTEDQKEWMTNLSIAANRPLNWNLLAPNSAHPEMVEAQLSAGDYAKERGGKIVALTPPQVINLRINLVSGFLFDTLPEWPAVVGLPLAERLEAIKDPAIRAKLEAAPKDAPASFARMFVWENLKINETFTEANKQYEGMTVGEYAGVVDKKPFDAMMDLCISDKLRTSFSPPPNGLDDETWNMRRDVWLDDRAIVGASDAGAHLDMIDTFAFSTQLLGEGVRKRSLLTMEQAVRQLTQVPAELYGFKDRGLIKEGNYADLVIFDENTIECGEVYTRHDLPNDEMRLYADATGVEQVLVNGKVIIADGEYTNVTAGRMMRSGQDTYSVEVPAGVNREAS